MNTVKLLISSDTPPLHYAAKALSRQGIDIIAEPAQDATHLLLPVPSFAADGTLRGGGDIASILSKVSPDIVIIGGNLNHPACAGHATFDLLQNEAYLSQNAAITAHCAVREALPRLQRTLNLLPVLVIGWGRIGKCLAALLQKMGASVTVAARKPSDRAMLRALGFDAVGTQKIDPEAYRLIFNTAPTMILPQCAGDALKIDLASRPGIGGPDILWARGLPGQDAPESSGELIAKTILPILCKKE